MAESESETIRSIVATVRDMEVTETDAWDVLSALASVTEVDAMEIFEDEIQIDGEKFSGPLLWYVTLIYGPPNDQVVSSESFPGKFEGHIENGVPSVDSMTMDTSSFYE
jgi:hypothetical protein